MPVGIARAVCGHLTMTIPICVSPLECRDRPVGSAPLIGALTMGGIAHLGVVRLVSTGRAALRRLLVDLVERLGDESLGYVLLDRLACLRRELLAKLPQFLVLH